MKPHAVFLPKTMTPTVVEGGKYFASDGGKWVLPSPDPNEAWTLFKLYRNEERKSQQLRQQLATGHKVVEKEEKPKVLTGGDATESFLKSYRLKILSGERKRACFWLKKGKPDPGSIHWGFDADNNAKVDELYQAAIGAGATDNISPRVQLEYYPGHFAADVLGPDGYSFEKRTITIRFSGPGVRNGYAQILFG